MATTAESPSLGTVFSRPFGLNTPLFEGITSEDSREPLRNFMLALEHHVIVKSHCDVWMDHPIEPNASRARPKDHTEEAVPRGWMRIRLAETYHLVPPRRRQVPGSHSS